jgi:hypothetical protein
MEGHRPGCCAAFCFLMWNGGEEVPPFGQLIEANLPRNSHLFTQKGGYFPPKIIPIIIGEQRVHLRTSRDSTININPI